MSTEKPTCVQIIFGLPFLVAGLFIIGSAITGNGVFSYADSPQWVLALIGLPFLLVGTYFTGFYRLVADRFPKLQNLQIKWYELWMGLLACSIGLLIIVLSVVDSDDNFNAPRWVVTAAGGAFFFAGLAIVSSQAFPNASKKFGEVAGQTFGTLIVTCFTVVVLGIVLDPQEQADISARICFVPSALFMTGLTILLWSHAIRKGIWPIIARHLASFSAVKSPVELAVPFLVLFILVIFVIGLLADRDRRASAPAHVENRPTATAPF
jgi:hypothetical protein